MRLPRCRVWTLMAAVAVVALMLALPTMIGRWRWCHRIAAQHAVKESVLLKEERILARKLASLPEQIARVRRESDPNSFNLELFELKFALGFDPETRREIASHAKYHTAMRQKYEHAIWKPWQVPSPDSPDMDPCERYPSPPLPNVGHPWYNHAVK